MANDKKKALLIRGTLLYISSYNKLTGYYLG